MKNLLTYEQFINESKINEGNVKQFEMAMKNLINNIRRGYGWIDPEYVYDTVVTDSEFDDFNWNDIKDEVYQRLIDQNLLYYSNDADPEVKGKKVSKVSQIEESVNEGKGVHPEVKRSCVERLSQFFRVPANNLNKFKFDGTDDIKALTKALNSTSEEGTRNYYEVAIKIGKQDAGIDESVNEAFASSDVKKAADLINKEIGVNPGYFFIADKDEIKKFDTLWNKKKYQEALNMLASTEVINSGSLETDDYEGLADYIKTYESKINEANDEFVPATLIKDFEDLRKDQIIKINALDFTQGADKETVECIRPDGKKMEIKKAIIEVKI